MSGLEIRPYQSEGIEFLTSRRRAALWDRPGLGKTMQSLLSMDYVLGSGARILVVATGDAVGVWRDETAKWLGTEAAVYAGTKASTDALYHEGVVITNYHRMPAAFGRHWDGVIFDESQMLRNRNTRTLFHYVRKRMTERHSMPAYFLSGTPIVKHAGDVWPILYMIDRKRWPSYWAFVNKYCVTYQDDLGHWHVEGVTNLKEMWPELASVSLRRENKSATPGRVRQRVPLDMTPKQGKAYKDVLRHMWTEIDDGSLLLTGNALARETRLRQILVCPRIVGIEDDGAGISALRDIAVRGSDPFVVFTPFAEAIPFVRDALGSGPNGRPVLWIRAGVDAHSIAKLFEEYAKAGQAPVLVSTVQMGKSWDVTKSGAYECFMLGVDWNETTMDQAESRLDRTGQTRLVTSHYFVHNGAHDSDALDILAGKRRLADAILDHKAGIRRKTL